MPEVTDVYNAIRRTNFRSQPVINVYDNHYAAHPTEYDTWKAILEIGKSYLVGDHMTMPEFLKRHRSRLVPWQIVAYHWALEHPEKRLVVRTQTREWHVCKRGEYVEFGLPHQDLGGERHYVSNNGLSKVLINDD